jgi:hypothetical protein
MKKVFFILAFAFFLVAAAFAQMRGGSLDTPEGQLYVQYGYIGKNCGQQTADDRIQDARKTLTVETDIKLSTVKWDIIRSGLSVYEPHSRGDTYLFMIADSSKAIGTIYVYEVIIEYTSTTQYTYWLWVGYR